MVERTGGVKGYNICVTKTIPATPDRVYQALCDTRSWLGAGSKAEWSSGGTFDDGDGHRGTFQRVNPGKVVKFTWEGAGHQAGETVRSTHGQRRENFGGSQP